MEKFPNNSERIQRLAMRVILDLLLKEGSNFIEGDLEFEVDGEINSAEIRESLDLPYELIFTELNGKVILTTMKNPGRTGEGVQSRMVYSMLWAHTHPKGKDRVIVDTTSIQDLMANTMISNLNSRRLIFHEKGIVQFGPIARNPATGEVGVEELEGAAGSIFQDFMERFQVELQRSSYNKYPFISDKYSAEERKNMADNFANEMGVILNKVSWDDVTNVEEMMRLLNRFD